ncbi:hypothetical protein L9F63_013911, partial [Diploptera punctata]
RELRTGKQSASTRRRRVQAPMSSNGSLLECGWSIFYRPSKIAKSKSFSSLSLLIFSISWTQQKLLFRDIDSTIYDRYVIFPGFENVRNLCFKRRSRRMFLTHILQFLFSRCRKTAKPNSKSKQLHFHSSIIQLKSHFEKILLIFYLSV